MYENAFWLVEGRCDVIACIAACNSYAYYTIFPGFSFSTVPPFAGPDSEAYSGRGTPISVESGATAIEGGSSPETFRKPKA